MCPTVETFHLAFTAHDSIERFCPYTEILSPDYRAAVHKDVYFRPWLLLLARLYICLHIQKNACHAGFVIRISNGFGLQIRFQKLRRIANPA